MTSPTPDLGDRSSWAPPVGPLVDAKRPKPLLRYRLLKWGGIALMVIGFVGLILDWSSRNIEMNRLLDQITVSESAMDQADQRIADIAHALPAKPTQNQIEQARAQIQQAAVQGRDEIAAAQNGVQSVSFLFWQPEMVKAQTAYLNHNRAWVFYMDALSRDPSVMATAGGPTSSINLTWTAATTTMRDAVPPLAWPGLEDRVNQIFSDQSQDSGSSGKSITT